MADDLSVLLCRIRQGDSTAVAALTPLVYEQLRAIAGRMLRSSDRRQMDATEVVHEAYLRLLGDSPIAWKDRAHFFATASTVIRRILVDAARRRMAKKRGGDAESVPLEMIGTTDRNNPIDVLMLDEALRQLAELSPRQATLVELRFFGGLTQDEAAQLLGVSRRTVAGDWAMARAWLQRQLQE